MSVQLLMTNMHQGVHRMTFSGSLPTQDQVLDDIVTSCFHIDTTINSCIQGVQPLHKMD